MRILGIETSGDVTGVALVDEKGVLAELSFRHTMQLSRFLLPRTEELLALAGLTVRDLDGIAVSIGPGSFTGLRIGVTTAKTLAYAAEVPVVGVPTLEALALETAAPPGALVAALMSASSTDVFAALYQWSTGKLEPRAEELMLPAAELAQRLARTPLDVVLTGVIGPHRQLFSTTAGNRITITDDDSTPRPATIAAYGRRRLLAGGGDPVHALAPRYLRPSAAEARREIPVTGTAP